MLELVKDYRGAQISRRRYKSENSYDTEEEYIATVCNGRIVQHLKSARLTGIEHDIDAALLPETFRLLSRFEGGIETSTQVRPFVGGLETGDGNRS